jgi:hypothetical protein
VDGDAIALLQTNAGDAIGLESGTSFADARPARDTSSNGLVSTQFSTNLQHTFLDFMNLQQAEKNNLQDDMLRASLTYSRRKVSGQGTFGGPRMGKVLLSGCGSKKLAQDDKPRCDVAVLIANPTNPAGASIPRFAVDDSRLVVCGLLWYSPRACV